MNPRPINMRKKVQFMVALTLLAWATQTLYHQWGFGGLILPPGPADTLRPTVTLELSRRIEARGEQVTLTDVCRWSQQDSAVMEPLAGLVLMRLGDAGGVRAISIADIRSALRDAGAHLTSVEFTGAARCAVTRGEVTEEQIAAAFALVDEPAATAPPAGNGGKPMIADLPRAPLRDLLVSGLIQRIALPAEQVQIDFDPADEATLAMSAPQGSFDVDSSQANGLGQVRWEVTVKSGMSEQRVTIGAHARAWEQQLIATRPLSRGQQMIASDIAARRELVDELSPSPASDPDQLIGQLTSRDLKPGDVLSIGDVTSPPLVTAGQFMTISMTLGGSTVQTVVRAMDSAAKDGFVRARNEASGEIYRVRVTGTDVGQVVSSKIAKENVATINPGL